MFIQSERTLASAQRFVRGGRANGVDGCGGEVRVGVDEEEEEEVEMD
jgi:hypothetical protein